MASEAPPPSAPPRSPVVRGTPEHAALVAQVNANRALRVTPEARAPTERQRQRRAVQAAYDAARAAGLHARLVAAQAQEAVARGALPARADALRALDTLKALGALGALGATREEWEAAVGVLEARAAADEAWAVAIRVRKAVQVQMAQVRAWAAATAAEDEAREAREQDIDPLPQGEGPQAEVARLRWERRRRGVHDPRDPD